MVWAAQNGPCRAGRLVCESAEVSARAEAADRQGARAGNGFWFVGGAGDGESGLGSLPQTPGLGVELSRAAADGAAQSIGAEPGATRCARLCAGLSRQAAYGE